MTITIRKALYTQGIVLILVVATRVWFQTSFEPLSTNWTELQTKLFEYDWVPMLINCTILLLIATLSFYRKTIAFILTAAMFTQYLATSIGCILELPQGGTSYFLIKPQLFAIFTVITFTISIIGISTWIYGRYRTT